MAEIRLAELAEITGASLEGSPDLLIRAVAPVDQAQAGELSFISNPKYLSGIAACKAEALIVSPKMDVSAFKGALLKHNNPYFAYAKVMQYLYPEAQAVLGIHPSAVVADDVSLGNKVSIGPNAVVESGVSLGDNVVIGAGCVVGTGCQLAADVQLMANVTLYHGVRIGKASRIHSGSIIGSDGFGYAPDQHVWHKIPQVGSVQIGDNVEIGANTTIDRGALNDTIIGNGVILDNQIQIGHNCVIGDYTAMAGATAIAGSTTVGKRCQIGGAVCMAGHITIADDVIVTGMGMVASSIKQSGVYSSGVPVAESKRWRRNAVRFSQLDDMAKTIRDLQKQLAELNQNQSGSSE